MSTYRESDDGYWIERGTIEDPSLSKDDYRDAAANIRAGIWNGANCQACGTRLSDATTACVQCDTCDNCGPVGGCRDCADHQRQAMADRVRRAANEADAMWSHTSGVNP